MAIEIRMSGLNAEEELRSLYAWLQEEPEVRRSAQVSLASGSAEPVEGQMGGTVDIIQLIVDDGFQALNFALAYAAWRGTRARRPSVTIEHGGSKVTLDDADPDSVRKIADALS